LAIRKHSDSALSSVDISIQGITPHTYNIILALPSIHPSIHPSHPGAPLAHALLGIVFFDLDLCTTHQKLVSVFWNKRRSMRDAIVLLGNSHTGVV
jgi:hypothetical protein